MFLRRITDLIMNKMFSWLFFHVVGPRPAILGAQRCYGTTRATGSGGEAYKVLGIIMTKACALCLEPHALAPQSAYF